MQSFQVKRPQFQRVNRLRKQVFTLDLRRHSIYDGHQTSAERLKEGLDGGRSLKGRVKEGARSPGVPEDRTDKRPERVGDSPEPIPQRSRSSHARREELYFPLFPERFFPGVSREAGELVRLRVCEP